MKLQSFQRNAKLLEDYQVWNIKETYQYKGDISLDQWGQIE